MRCRNVVLIILLIPIFTAIALFHFKYITKFQFSSFMSTLQSKAHENSLKRNETYPDEFIEEFEKVFCRYTDSNGLSRAIPQAASLVILILTIIELLLLVIIQLKRSCCGCCKETFSLIFLIHSLFDMLLYLVFAFDDQTEVNLNEDQIYSFDEEFNNEIRKNLDFMKKRKIYLIVCSSVAIVGVLSQLIIVILNMREDCCLKNNNNNNNINGQQDIVVYTVENTNQANNVNSNNETDKRAI